MGRQSRKQPMKSGKHRQHDNVSAAASQSVEVWWLGSDGFKLWVSGDHDWGGGGFGTLHWDARKIMESCRWVFGRASLFRLFCSPFVTPPSSPPQRWSARGISYGGLPPRPSIARILNPTPTLGWESLGHSHGVAASAIEADELTQFFPHTFGRATFIAFCCCLSTNSHVRTGRNTIFGSACTVPL